MATTRTSSAGKVSSGSWESEKREHPQGCSLLRLSKKWQSHFFEKVSLRSAPRLSAESGQLEVAPLRHYDSRAFWRANRAASSKTVRCFRRRRRFTVFHSAQSVFCQKVNCPAAGKRSPSGGRTCRGRKRIIQLSRLQTPGQPLAALLLYGCRVPLAGKNSARLFRQAEEGAPLRVLPLYLCSAAALLFSVHAQREKPPLICKDKKTIPRCCGSLRSSSPPRRASRAPLRRGRR